MADHSEPWRPDRVSGAFKKRIDDLGDQLARHWTAAVVDAARDGYPYAYGAARLGAARSQLVEQIQHLDQCSSEGPLTDPIRALSDLDHAARAHPPGLARRPDLGPWPGGMDVNARHQLYQRPYPGAVPEPPSASMGI